MIEKPLDQIDVAVSGPLAVEAIELLTHFALMIRTDRAVAARCRRTVANLESAIASARMRDGNPYGALQAMIRK